MIYFCIPALNEERTVGVVLWKLRQVMTELHRDFQVIVVDDASADSTQEVLQPYTRVLPLTVFRNETQLGYAASLEIAMREAVRRSPYPKRDAVITLQADFTEDPDVVPALIKRIEAGADLVATQPAYDEGAPRSYRLGRRLFNWLVRGREWAQLADPFAGMRAYRVMTLKRALDARGNARLLTWEGWAANAELMMQALPHSRRSDAVEATLHYRRLQRPTRFRFFATLSQVLGVRSGKPGRAAPLSLPEATIAVPGAVAVELATSHRREDTRRRPDARRSHTGTRRGESRRGESRRGEGRTRGPRPQIALVTDTVETEEAQPAVEQKKRRRRPRRRRKPAAQTHDQPQLTLESAGVAIDGTAEAEQSNGVTNGVAEGASAPRKKSRRGRRGGRGRRRGPRLNGEGAPNVEGSDNNTMHETTPEPTGDAAS